MTEHLAARIRIKQPGKAMGVTGHRPSRLGGYNPNNPIMAYVSQRLRQEFLHAIEEGFDTFPNGLAIGVDLKAAEIVLGLRELHPHIRLIGAVPFQGQELLWPPETQDHYHNILKQCDEVHYVCEPGYAPWKMQKRNEWIVDWPIKRLLAVWDGGDRGGTRNCVSYARRALHKPEIVQINPNDYREGV